MCTYTESSQPKSFKLLAVGETRAIYHCSCMQDFGSIPEGETRAINHFSRIQYSRPIQYCYITNHRFESCNFPRLPSICMGGRMGTEWSFSTASLSDVQAVRLSQKGGIELRYTGFSKCLGDFRPSEAHGWLENPVCCKISRTSDTRYNITFFGEVDKQKEAEVLPLSGKCIIFWSFGKESIIEIRELVRERL